VPYLLSAVVALLGLLLLVALLMRSRRPLRAFRQAASMVATNTQDRTGLIRARSAALRVAIAERRPAQEHPENQ
jgi:hypothetical protein